MFNKELYGTCVAWTKSTRELNCPETKAAYKKAKKTFVSFLRNIKKQQLYSNKIAYIRNTSRESWSVIKSLTNSIEASSSANLKLTNFSRIQWELLKLSSLTILRRRWSNLPTFKLKNYWNLRFPSTILKMETFFLQPTTSKECDGRSEGNYCEVKQWSGLNKIKFLTVFWRIVQRCCHSLWQKLSTAHLNLDVSHQKSSNCPKWY